MSGFVDQLMCLLLVSVSLSPLRCLGDGASGKERTLAMIKPDGVSGNYTDEIRRIIVEANFSIVKEMLTQLDKERASVFYDEHSSKIFFPDLVTYMTSGPVLVMVLEKRDAISDWRGLIGPTDAGKAKISHPHRFHYVPKHPPLMHSHFILLYYYSKMGLVLGSILLSLVMTLLICSCSIRALCGKDAQRNCVHGSDSTSSAEREIKFFFRDLVSSDIASKHDEL